MPSQKWIFTADAIRIGTPRLNQVYFVSSDGRTVGTVTQTVSDDAYTVTQVVLGTTYVHRWTRTVTGLNYEFRVSGDLSQEPVSIPLERG